MSFDKIEPMDKLLITFGTVLLIFGCSKEPTSIYLECQPTYDYGSSIPKDTNLDYRTHPNLSILDDAKPREIIIDTANKQIRMFWNIDYIFDTNYINNRDIISAEYQLIWDGETEIDQLHTFKLDKASGKAYWIKFWPNEEEDNNEFIKELECTKKQPIL